ncbi:hypothetical protein BDF22DRAFT_680991 [Syncephalis plumigaleata]|nr:hypothetical protein BDF22DRAFT_680991 [Syncephalis plumigaleata]
MTSLRADISKLPVHVLWRLFTFLDDASLLIFLSTCHHMLDITDENDSIGENWFKNRFGQDTDIKDWIDWHTQMLKEETAASNEKSNIIDYACNKQRWITHCIGRLRLEKNWQDGKYSLTSLTVPKVESASSTTSGSRIIFSNIWGTLAIIANTHFHYISHGHELKSFPLGNLVDNSSIDQIKSISGLSSNDFLVISILYKHEEFKDDSQKILYWRVNELEAMQKPCTVTPLKVAVQLNCLHDRWLLLQQSFTVDNARSSFIIDLMQSTPLAIDTPASWHTYAIVNTFEHLCTIYASRFNVKVDEEPQFTEYSWNLLSAGSIDVRPLSSGKKTITLNLLINTQKEHRAKLLSSDTMMVWQDLPEEARLYPSNQSTPPDQSKRVFFIHNINSTEVYYSGSFVGHTPTVSLHNKQIIMLNKSNLKLMNLSTKETIFETTVASSLTHLGFMLDRYWVSQHSGSGFYAMNIKDQSKLKWIPADNEEGTAAVNATSLVKLANNGKKLLVWSMQ